MHRPVAVGPAVDPRWRGLAVGAALVAALGAATPCARAGPAPPTLRVPIVIKVASCDGEPVRPAAWVTGHVQAANEVLAPYGVRLQPEVRSFAPGRCELLRRGHRDALATHVEPGSVTVLLVRRVRDLAVPSYDLMGVHWRYGGGRSALRGRRWVLLTARAKPPVLAHELAHYFGLRHDPAGGNLMTPGPSAPAWRRKTGRPAPYRPVLTRRQVRRLRRRVRRHLRARHRVRARERREAERAARRGARAP